MNRAFVKEGYLSMPAAAALICSGYLRAKGCADGIASACERPHCEVRNTARCTAKCRFAKTLPRIP